MTRNTTPSNRATICAADVIRALQDAAATAYPTRDDMADSAPNFDQQARALVYLCSETADRVPQEHWESQEFTVEGLTEQHTYGIQPGDHDIRARMQATQHAMQSARDAAAAELRAHCPDSFIRIRTGERSTMKILNTRERISEMVATVRRSPGLFGGGKVDKVAPARKATTWKARSVSMVWELIQDGDYSAALAMADTLGAMFYEFNGHAGLTWAPMPVDGMPEGFVSASAIGRGSGHCGAGRSFDFPVPRAFSLDSASSFCAACSHFTQKFDIPRYSAADPAKTSARKEFRPHAVIRLSIGRNQCVRVLMASPVPACDEGCSSCQ
jgi:hypothetical protein